MLYYGDIVYILEKTNLKAELLRLYYNDLFAGYFDNEKIFELFRKKFYWEGLTNNIKDYIFIYNIC